MPRYSKYLSSVCATKKHFLPSFPLRQDHLISLPHSLPRPSCLLLARPPSSISTSPRASEALSPHHYSLPVTLCSPGPLFNPGHNDTGTGTLPSPPLPYPHSITVTLSLPPSHTQLWRRFQVATEWEWNCILKPKVWSERWHEAASHLTGCGMSKHKLCHCDLHGHRNILEQHLHQTHISCAHSNFFFGSLRC